ncbi:MAG: hypothetical protein PHE53_04920 [Thermoguttaceae bacterium]|nr:hypothetical protein [Thermoguttaceae bacterium]
MESAGMVTITALKDKNHKGGVIPSKFHHLPVTGLSGWAFSGCENLTIDTPSIAYAAKYAEEKGIPMCT